MNAHHAIIPTNRPTPNGKLTQAEENIYGLISRFYLMQFAQDAIHREGRLTVGWRTTASGPRNRHPGVGLEEPGAENFGNSARNHRKRAAAAREE
ncbi:hypothetical protein ACFPTY_20110 [Halomonas beimenensis]|uniref:hypothetical protein n=1 Tax=Halomonas beimenensis TaxID=475662 RepID=UPI003622A365